MPHNAQTDLSGADLAAENRALRARVDQLQEQAAYHHALLGRHQAFDLEIVAAGSLVELLDSIFETLPRISELDSVTLSLLDEDDDILMVMERLGVDLAAFPQLILVRHEDELGFGEARAQPLLGPFEAGAHGALFTPAGPDLASVALVPLLRKQRLIGSLNLASADPARFTPRLGTDFILHLASIIAICLENVISHEILKYIGLTDALTGVYNRRYIDRRLPEEVARARRHGAPLACLYIDIDHFKRINDTLGHQGGDEVLREVAARIRHELRLSDALARFGGEEFIALLVDADLDSAALVAERIRAAIAAHGVGTAAFAVSVSVGVAALGPAEADWPLEAAAQQLVGRADVALYQAKAGGRNRVVRG